MTRDGRHVYATFDAGTTGTGGVAVVDVRTRTVVDTWVYPAPGVRMGSGTRGGRCGCSRTGYAGETDGLAPVKGVFDDTKHDRMGNRGRVSRIVAFSRRRGAGRCDSRAAGYARDLDGGAAGNPVEPFRHGLDARPAAEFAISHIPGAVNVAPQARRPDVHVRLRCRRDWPPVRNNKSAPLVLYCNGPHCGKSKRLASELLAAGYPNVRRYQLGIPMWRAAGGVCQVELEGIRHIVAKDGTAVVIDARESAEFQKGTLKNARNIPRSLVLEGKDVGEVKRAKDDSRLPMEDHNTRILVIGADGEAASYVAEALRASIPQRELLRRIVCDGAEGTDARGIAMSGLGR